MYFFYFLTKASVWFCKSVWCVVRREISLGGAIVAPHKANESPALSSAPLEPRALFSEPLLFLQTHTLKSSKRPFHPSKNPFISLKRQTTLSPKMICVKIQKAFHFENCVDLLTNLSILRILTAVNLKLTTFLQF